MLGFLPATRVLAAGLPLPAFHFPLPVFTNSPGLLWALTSSSSVNLKLVSSFPSLLLHSSCFPFTVGSTVPSLWPPVSPPGFTIPDLFLSLHAAILTSSHFPCLFLLYLLPFSLSSFSYTSITLPTCPPVSFSHCLILFLPTPSLCFFYPSCFPLFPHICPPFPCPNP